MSEQAPDVDTPDPANPTPGTEPAEGTLGTDQQQAAEQQQAAVDWEKRYSDLRPEYDRTAAEAAQYRQLVAALQSDDADTRRRAADALGFELADEDTEPIEYDDPLDELRAELQMTKREFQEFRDRHQQSAQESEREAQLDQIDKAARAKLEQIDGLDETSRDWIYDRALASHPPTPEGLPDIEAAHAEFVAFQNHLMQGWAKTKNAPHVSPVGTSATSAPNFDDRQQMEAWQVQRLQELET